MRSTILGALAGLAALVSTGASAGQGTPPHTRLAQLPPPFGAPGPITPGPQRCTPQYQGLLKLQMQGMRQLQLLSRAQGEQLCSTIEGADELGVDKLVDPKALQRFLTPQQREVLEAFGLDLAKVDVAKIMRLLGVDLSRIDLRQLKHQCRQGQGELDRYATNELGRLESEIVRCDDRI
jgi:hypothetical protein